MKFLSVCSGIEAASVAWNPLGWEAAAFAEIEPFPCAVLAHHYPHVPNWGDMTNFKEWPDVSIDLLCGGTPCQSFSVAGLRKGLDDPRGNLMLTFGAIAAKYRPRWLVWENVPGVLSSNGGDDLKAFLDMLESLGYVCDVEILDAQFFGVPQRRRRVFVCAQHRDDLLSQKTDTSALTITQCLQEILLCILSEARSRFASGQGSSDLPSRSKDGAKRRMELFGLAGEADCWPMLLENLAEAFRRLPQEQRLLGATHGEPGKEPTPGVQSTDSQTESLFTLTEQSLKNALDDALEVMRLFITSTATSSTTQAQIFSCSRAALLIAQLTQRLSQSSPAFWNSALSSLTAVEEFTDYARSTSSDLFGDLERLQSWCDFIEQAEHSNDTFIGFGVECFGEIFPLPDCLQGHPAPRREARKGSAGGPDGRAAVSSGHGWWDESDVAATLRAQDSVTKADTLHIVGTICVATGQAGAEIGAEIGADMAPTLNCNHEAPFAVQPTPGMQVRRLAPRECERLQGFPTVLETVRIQACIDHQNSVVRAAIQCRRLQNNAWSADENDSQPNAKTAAASLSTHQADHEPLAALHVRMHSVDELQEIRSAGRLIWSANGAGQSRKSLPPTLTENSVQELARLLREVARTITAGKAESPPSIRLSFPASSGAISAEKSGRETEASASDAMSDQHRAMFTTSDLGLITTFSDSTAETLCCFALHAIAGCIPSTTLPETFSIELTVETPYTAIPWRGKPADQCPDGPRYRALGNSWAVPNVRWIGQRIDAVQALIDARQEIAA